MRRSIDLNLTQIWAPLRPSDLGEIIAHLRTRTGLSSPVFLCLFMSIYLSVKVGCFALILCEKMCNRFIKNFT